MLDNSLKKYLNFKNGFFIEVGAHDGIFQSNTFRLENDLNWNGLLIEPSLNSYLTCLKNRPKSKCLNLALSSFDYYKRKRFIRGNFNNSPMSKVTENVSGYSYLENLKYFFRSWFKNEINSISVLPLQYLVDLFEIKKIDFLSLDVEGYEYEVLNGIDLKKSRPLFILVEVRNIQKEKIFKYLKKNNYEFLENISNFNFKDFPKWDGTHQDYIFKAL